ncbi:MAG: CHRD domain-containing protein [Thermodesulfobacteriota bacterium]
MRDFNALKTIVWLLVGVFMLLVTLASSKVAGEEAAASEAVTVEFKALNNSGESGKATLTPVDGKTKVVIDLTGVPEGVPQPAHIHHGTCEKLGGPAYPLEAVQNGKSETTVDAKLSDLTTGDFAINVHKSEEEISTYVACGDIPKS